jgi:hypothetical protein
MTHALLALPYAAWYQAAPTSTDWQKLLGHLQSQKGGATGAGSPGSVRSAAQVSGGQG